MKPQLLVIDDIVASSSKQRDNFCRLLQLSELNNPQSSHKDSIAEVSFCSAQHHNSYCVENRIDIALQVVQKGWPNHSGQFWSLVLLDLRFLSGKLVKGYPEGSPDDDLYGLKILAQLSSHFPGLPIVILSSASRESVITQCRKLGAKDFMSRLSSGSVSEMKIELENKLFSYGLLPDDQNIIIGNSIELLNSLAIARRSARGSGHVLLLGESGVGKELYAQYIYNHSDRKEQAFHTFYPFGVAESLQQDNLFGHIKGAFTGAEQDRAGLFELSSNGVLFIDEVGDIDISVQNQLLRPLESRRLTRQGSAKEIHLNTKVILATNKELDTQVKTGAFKSDLLNRIKTYEVIIPPLRERQNDIPLVANHLIKQLCIDNGLHWPRTIGDDAMHALLNYHWRDGNVRALRNKLERAVRNNPDSELLIAADLEIEYSVEIKEIQQKTTLSTFSPKENIPIPKGLAAWDQVMSENADRIGKMFTTAITYNAVYDTQHDDNLRINISATVSYLQGKKLSTVKAADVIKRELNYSEKVLREVFLNYPLVARLYDLAINIRASGSRKTSFEILKYNRGDS